MQYWEEMIKTAMLGTDKKPYRQEVHHQDLLVATESIAQNNSIDKEEQFLQNAALVFNYRQCGAVAMEQKEAPLNVATEEEKNYCNNTATQLLKELLAEESNPLLQLWLQQCNQQQLLVTPVMVPTLLQKAEHHKDFRYLITNCCGKRGEWLSRFNAAWQFSVVVSEEETWQTGSLEQRRQLLARVRTTNPLQASEWLMQTWPQENAATRLELLKAWSIKLTVEDISWLETLLADKSQRIKEEALNLLKQIPSSNIVKQYCGVLREAIQLKKEKALLGLTSKTNLQVKLPETVAESIYGSGIEKLSSQPKITDEQIILFQLISAVPPSFWEEHLNETPAQLIQLFRKEKTTALFIPALAIAAAKFQDITWAKLFAETDASYYDGLAPLLTPSLKKDYLLKHFDQHTSTIMNVLLSENKEWDIALARTILKHTAKTSYQYNRSFYKEYIHLMPVQLIHELDQFTPSEEYPRSVWRNTSSYIQKLLELKSKINQTFIHP